LGSEYLIDKYSDLVEGIGYDYGRPTGSLAETAGRVTGGILAPTGGAAAFGRGVDLIGAGIDAYAAGAPARVADRARTTTLRSGVDPTAFIDDMIVRGMGDNGGVSPADTPRGLLDQPQAAQGEPVGLLADDPVRQMDTAQARYFETGKFEPPTAKNVDQARAALEASPNDPVLKQQYLDLRRARDAELSQMPASEQLELDTSYRMQHQPRGPQDGGGRLDDITAGGELFPDDVYSADGLRFYGNPNNSFDRQSYAAILSARGNPEAEITIYRGVPTDVNQINAGDWVTLSPDYAAMHAADGYGPNGYQAGKVISQQVKVKDVFSDGNDLNEFGYFPADLAELGVKKIVPPTPDEPGIIAFHGSGADFDEFRLEMIGTGEGAQAYGYGLYFTDSEDIAKFYRDSIGRGRSSIVYDGSSVKNARETDSLTDREMILDNIATEMAFFDQKPANVIERKIKSLKARIDDPVDISPYADDAEAQGLANLVRQSAQRELEIYENLDPGKFTRGKMYKVGLAPKPDELLDYDLPLSQQPKKYKAALDEIAKIQGIPVVDQFGQSASFSSFQDALDRKVGPVNAMREFTDAGIPGIKYFDNASRNTSGGKLIDITKAEDGFRAKVAVDNRAGGLGGSGRIVTTSAPYKTRQEALGWADEKIKKSGRNYVIFDDKAIKILEKYGIAGPVLVTGAGMAREEQPRLTRGIL
jgi:hypothetical protein